MALKQVFISLDQTANALSGGNADSTISACAYKYRAESRFWKILEKVLDFTFEPLDGKGHCKLSFDNDPCEVYINGGLFRKVRVSLFAIPFCVLMAVPFRIAGHLKRS